MYFISFLIVPLKRKYNLTYSVVKNVLFMNAFKTSDHKEFRYTP